MLCLRVKGVLYSQEASNTHCQSTCLRKELLLWKHPTIYD